MFVIKSFLWHDSLSGINKIFNKNFKNFIYLIFIDYFLLFIDYFFINSYWKKLILYSFNSIFTRFSRTN